MPYSGAPSKACEKCRKRKIRCDQNQNGCSQCATIRQDCPGYRSHLDLLFRNQTDTIAETVKREKAKVRKGQPSVKARHLSVVRSPAAVKVSTTLPPGTQKLSESAIRTLKAPINSLPLSFGDLGVCYFMDRFVLGMVGSVQQRHMHPFVSITYKSDPQLLACMQAVGLAVLSNLETSVSLMTSAHRYYGIALRLTNSALQFRADAIKDSTILAIMTLSLWDNVTGNSPQSLTSWRNHVHGIAEIIRLRGPKQFETIAGLRMFLQVFTSILTNCIQKELCVPIFAITLWHQAARYWNIDTTDPSWRVQELAIRLAHLRAGINDGRRCSSDDIVSEALIIDNALASIFEKPSSLWQYGTKYIDAYPKLVYQYVYHVYSNELVTQTWNSMRINRIFLNEIILTQLSKKLKKITPRTLTTDDQAQYMASMETLKKMTADILGSVPQSIGYIPLLEGQQNPAKVPNSGSTSRPRSRPAPEPAARLHPRFCEPFSIGSLHSSASEDELPIMRGSSGCLLIWHLYHVGTIDTTTTEARQWIINILRFEGQVTGVGQAILLAGTLEKQIYNG